ncbi:MAG: hypothetical protein ACK5ME_07625 [Parahaliea sp.]
MTGKILRFLGLILGFISILLGIVALLHFEVEFYRLVLPLIMGAIFMVYGFTGKGSVREFRQGSNSDSEHQRDKH